MQRDEMIATINKHAKRARWVKKWMTTPLLFVCFFMSLLGMQHDRPDLPLWIALTFLNLVSFAAHTFVIRQAEIAKTLEPDFLRQKRLNELYGRDDTLKKKPK